MAGNRVISAVLTLKDKDFGTTARKSAKELKTMEQQTKRVTGTVNKFGKSATSSFKSVALGAAGAVAGLMAINGIKNFGSSVIDTFKEFDQGLGDLQAVTGIADKTSTEFQMLEDKAREMGRATSKSAAEATEGLKYLGLAGWSTQEMVDGIHPTLKLAEAGALDLGRASDLVTDSMSAMGVGVDGLEGYLDQVAQTSRNANTDIDTLMEAFVIAGGTFSRLNVPLEESNAMLGILANRGTKGAEAGTAINAIMDRMTQTTGPAGKAMKELGISAFDANGKFRGMETVMKDVAGALDGMNDEQKAYYQSQIAGLNHGKSFEKMIQGLGDEYDSLKSSIGESKGALDEMADAQMDTLEGSLSKMHSAIDDVKLTIGNAVGPIIRRVADAIAASMPTIQKYTETAMEKLMEFGSQLKAAYEGAKPGLSWMKDTAFPMIAGAIGIVTDTATGMYNFIVNNWVLIGPVIAGVAAAVGGYKLAVMAVSAATRIWGAVTTTVQVASMLLNGTLAVTPLGWLVIAIGAVVAAGVALYQNWDTVKAAAQALWDKVKDVGAGIGEAFSAGFAVVKSAAMSSLNFVIDKINSVINLINKIPGVNVPIVAKVDTSQVEAATGPQASYAVGTNRVPRDMVAQIHKDEMIIPATQSERLRKQGVTIDNIDQPTPPSPSSAPRPSINVATGGGSSDELARAIRELIAFLSSIPKGDTIINVNGTNKTVTEIVNELIPMLKQRMANM